MAKKSKKAAAPRKKAAKKAVAPKKSKKSARKSARKQALPAAPPKTPHMGSVGQPPFGAYKLPDEDQK